MAELKVKEVKVFFYVIDDVKLPNGRNLYRTCRLEIHDGPRHVGYYRIWHDEESENIAFYSEKDRHGVLPPGEYKSVPTNHKMIGLIEKDLNMMGYTIPDGHKVVTDAMLTGSVPFPTDWAGWSGDELVEPTMQEVFKVADDALKNKPKTK